MAACMDVVVPCMHERKQSASQSATSSSCGASSPTCIRLGRPRAYVYAVGRACDRGGHARTLRNDAAATILYSAEKATWMAGEAIQALGGVHQRVSDRPSLAQCKTLRDRRGHLGGAAHADRLRTDGGNGVSPNAIGIAAAMVQPAAARQTFNSIPPRQEKCGKYAAPFQYRSVVPRLCAQCEAMRSLIADLREKRSQVAGGGEASRNRHTSRGKMPARDRGDLLVSLHSDFDRLGPAIRLARAGVLDQRGPRCCEEFWAAS
jgi:hypothetical protein